VTNPLPHIALFLPNLDGGGAERAVVALAGQMASFDIRVELVVANTGGPYLGEIDRAVRLIDLKATRMRATIPGLIRYVRREQPDVLASALDHSSMVAAITLCTAMRPTRFVILQRSCVTACWATGASNGAWLSQALYRWTYQRAHLIIGNSLAVTSDLHDNLGVRWDRLAFIHNSIDATTIHHKATEPLPSNWNRLTITPFILAVGTLEPVKDFETLIRVFSVISDRIPHDLVILGEGSERHRLTDVIVKLGMPHRIHLPGFDLNPFRWMKHARVMVSSSLTEGCPNVLQQALACGTPIVATDCPGGTAEILEDGKWGRLVPVGDPQAMADAIIKTLEDKHLPNGRVRAADFDPRKNALEYLRLLLPDFVPPPMKRTAL